MLTARSSSENYVGNIFYDKGLAIITETGSWSGSVNYSDLATNFTLKFDSQMLQYQPDGLSMLFLTIFMM